MKIDAVIIGCGKIAGGFNETDETAVLTHVAACRRLGVTVAGCVDINQEAANHFAARWQIPHAGADVAAVLAVCQPSLVCLCTPPAARLSLLRQILAAASVRSVLVEKPLAATASEAGEMVALAKASGKQVTVNFCRAFDPFYLQLEQRIRGGEFGRFTGGTARYYGTAQATASHWVERVLALFGQPGGVRHLSGPREAPVFQISFGEASLIFMPTPGCAYSPFELDLFFEKGRVRILDSERRAEFFQSRPDPTFAGYFNLAPSEGTTLGQPSHEAILWAVQSAAAAAGQDHAPDYALLERSAAVVDILETAGGKP